MRQTSKYLALGLLAVLICSAIPALADHIPANGIDLHRVGRVHDSDDVTTGITGSNPFSGGPHNSVRPDRPNQFVVSHDDDQDVMDDDSRDQRNSRGTLDPQTGGDQTSNNNAPVAPVPEPTTIALIAPAALAIWRKLRK